MTKVVNIFNYKGDYTYIGRAGKGYDGFFGNPHVIGFCKICNESHDREQCIEAFREDFYKRIKTDKEYKRRVLELKDRILGCFCKSHFKEVPCHGDIIAAYLDNLDKENP